MKDQWEPSIVQSSLGASYRVNNFLSLFINSAAGQIKPINGSLNTELSEPLNETRYKADIGIMRTFGKSGKIVITAFGVLQKNAITLSGDTYLDTITGIRRELYINRDQNQSGLELEIITPKLFGFMEPFLNFTLMRSLMKEAGDMISNDENPVIIASGGFYMTKNSFDINLFL